MHSKEPSRMSMKIDMDCIIALRAMVPVLSAITKRKETQTTLLRMLVINAGQVLSNNAANLTTEKRTLLETRVNDLVHEIFDLSSEENLSFKDFWKKNSLSY